MQSTNSMCTFSTFSWKNKNCVPKRWCSWGFLHTLAWQDKWEVEILEIIKTPANYFLPPGSAKTRADSGSGCKFYSLLLCKVISLGHNKESSISLQTFTFLALSLRRATFRQANIWSLISPFGGLERCRKGHYVGDLPTTTVPLPHLMLICSQCSYCFWSLFLYVVTCSLP